ncbi:MAG: hypothetical protein H0V34_05745 [Gammaproteobacteria bacterium]|nr:hypothetical protein [Gammaproteobacteria bacterium]
MMSDASRQRNAGARLTERLGTVPRDTVSYLSNYAAFLLLEFTALVLLLTSILFFARIEITPYHVAAAFIVTFLTPFVYRSRPEIHGSVSAAALASSFALLCIATVVFSGCFYDFSFDGQGYRQEAIIQLANGWNPVYERVPEDVQRSIWINHYSKGPWITAAALYKLTGNIEQGKTFNLLLILASFFLCLSVLLRIKQIDGRIAFIFSLLLALNPVSVYQTLTFYIDGQLSSLLVCLVASLTAILLAVDKLTLASLSFVILIALNVKFTAVPYVAFIGLGFIVAAALMGKTRPLRRAIWASILCFAAGVLVVGYNPYVTNTLYHGHPFFPLFGEGHVDIMDGPKSTPVSLRGLNRVEKLYQSVFAKSQASLTAETELKIPLTVTSLDEIRPFGSPSTRIGGWGPLFSGVLVLSVIGLLWTLVRSPALRKIGLIVMGISAYLLASALIHEEGWYARFAPQLYCIPVIITMFLVSVHDRVANIVGGIVAVALTLNILTIGGVYLYKNLKWNYKLGNQMAELARVDGAVQVYFGDFRSTRVRFEKAIPYKEVSTQAGLACKTPMEIIHATALVCP